MLRWSRSPERERPVEKVPLLPPTTTTTPSTPAFQSDVAIVLIQTPIKHTVVEHSHHHKHEPIVYPLWWCVLTAVGYGVGSGSMTFLNKALVASYGFDSSNVLLWIQMITCVVAMMIASIMGMLDWKITYDTKLYWKLLPISIAFMGNAGMGLAGLRHLSLPMFSVLKRLTPVVVCIADYMIWGKKATKETIFSLVLVTIGLLIAGWGDLVFDLTSYTFAGLSCVSQAMYLLLVSHLGKQYHLSSSQLLFYNSFLSIPLLTPFILYNNEMNIAINYPYWFDMGFLFWLGLTLILGISLNYLQFACTQANSPLTTSMVGVFKSIFTTFAGFFLFAGQPFTITNVAGTGLNTVGGVAYAHAEYVEKQRKKRMNQTEMSVVSVKQASEVPTPVIDTVVTKPITTIPTEAVAILPTTSSA